TIEPRKGHDCLIAAMEYLWASEADAPPLVIVGRPGWRTEPLQAQMRELETREPRFLWLDNASDELLAELYGRAALVAVPSRGEGFGLPIVEALRHGRKILARDIPVFRELAQPGLSYFDDETPPALAARLQEVLQKPDPAPVTGAGWDVSAEALLRALGIKIDPPAVSRSS
ncbi:MAG: glycosyltransferase, partial [Pseudomonadota bacterium]|nr:glycosyltransferase [Pseudomonadota bacterium]